jgi:phospholipid-binding lipoprotein MlaA
VLINLDAPVTFANDILQLEPTDAAVTLARFAVNTTVGIAGLFDVASSFDLEGHESDFGQTLALSGVPSGPYLIFPVLGPTTARDGTGFLVDFLFRPTTYLLTPGGAFFLSSFGTQSGQQVLLSTLFEGSTEIAEGITTREAAGEGLHALEASSLDYYAALRNAYYQNRTALVWRRGPEHGPLAVARRALTVLPFRASGGEVRDLPAHGGEQPVESVALEH